MSLLLSLSVCAVTFCARASHVPRRFGFGSAIVIYVRPLCLHLFCFCFCFAFFIELVEFVQVLICKDWCAFGHRFATRSGHGRDPGGETSPIFPQFLDATYQLLRQFPTSFEFSENLLILLLHAYHSRWDPRLLVRCFRVFGTTLRHVEGCHGVTPLVTAYHGVRFGILRHATSQYGSSPHV